MRALEIAQAIWRNSRRKPGAPRFLTYIVTFNCNARCIMCDSWKKPSPNDLTFEEIEDIFAQLPRMDAVRLTGGEPFARRDMVEIADLAQSRLRPMFLHVTTNGFLTPRIVDFCQRRTKDIPLQLLISVDGVGEKHNHVRGKESAWDSVTRTIAELAPRQKELRLNLSVNQTIVDPEGVEHYRLLRDFLKPFGVRNHVVMAYAQSATYSVEAEKVAAPREIGQFTTFGDFRREHLEQLIADVEADIEHYPAPERAAKRYYWQGIRNRLLNETGDPNPKCVALNAHMRLLPNGDVPVCQFNTTKVGNLREKSFHEVWYGGDIAKQRDWVNKCPGCWAECEVLPSAIYTGDLVMKTLMPSRGDSPATHPAGHTPLPLAK